MVEVAIRAESWIAISLSASANIKIDIYIHRLQTLTLRSKLERFGDESLIHACISFIHGYIWWRGWGDIAT